MNHSSRWKALFGIGLSLALGTFFLPARPTSPSAHAATVPSGPYSVFLPLILRDYPLQTVFGVQMDEITEDGGLDQVAATSLTWIRPNAVIWSEIEPSRGTRNWDAMAGLENELQNVSSKGIQTILVVRSTPRWAQEVAGSYCGPIMSNYLPEFGDFMHDLVARYSVWPYNVKYWEIWNEPDVAVVQGDSFGCWGNSGDPYFGGGYYAEMLKAVYPKIKTADQNAQVVVGGLLLDCDPRGTPSPCDSASPNPPHDTRPPLFLKGILLNGGGAYFDGVAFHAYDYYGGAEGQYANSNWGSSWNTTGPVAIAKAEYIKSLLATHGASGKLLMNTESAILCDTCNSDPTFEDTKAYYVAQVYASAIAQGLRANIWYTARIGWRNSGLLNSDLSERPAYTAFQFARSEIRNASFVRNITEYGANVKGYVFNHGNRKVWILWSLDSAGQVVTLSTIPLAIWDVLGTAIPLTTSPTVGLEPMYLEFQ